MVSRGLKIGDWSLPSSDRKRPTLVERDTSSTKEEK